MDNRTNELLQKYHRNELRSEELKELVEGIRRSTDEDLRSCLEEHWATYEGFADLSEEKRQRLFPLLEHHGQKTWLNGWRRYWLPVAASVLLLLSGSLSVLYLTQYQEMQTLAERNIEIRSGEYEPSMVVLPDGTRVRLNARSVLSYHQDFGTDMRHVQLSGEGFFEVRHDASRPFIVTTDCMDITVLGTTFNVYAYEQKDFVEMSLVEGRVKVSTLRPPYQSLEVRPNEKVTYNKQTDALLLTATDNRIETAWTEKELTFRHDRLEDVLKSLERKFGVSFVIDHPALLDDTYTGVFDEQNLDSILRVLQLHYGFEYRKEGDTILLKERPAN